MKPLVLHAVDGFLARSETFVYTYACAHQAYDAAVLCHARLNETEFPFPRVHAIGKPRSRKTVEWWAAAAVERATGRSPWRRKVEQLIGRVKPSVVHAHFGPIGCELADIARASGIPLVTSLYGVDAAVLPHLPQWRAAYERLFALGDLFLAEGPEMRKKVIAAGAPPGRTAIQPIAVQLDKYPRWTPGADAPVLFVGRFVQKKGLLDAIAAFERVARHRPSIRMTIVGGGPDEQAARAFVDRHDLGPRIDFLGMRAHADVIDRLRQAAVLIHPSVTADDGDSEGGAPTILLEAQAIGTPIVTTRHADIPNVVPEGRGVFLCAEHDVAALSEALGTALDQRQPSSPAHVIAHHDVRIAVRELEYKYRALNLHSAISSLQWQQSAS